MRRVVVTGMAQHCFSLNGNIFDPELNGLDGVIDAYKQALNKIAFYGPNYMAHVLRMVVNFAEKEKVSQDK